MKSITIEIVNEKVMKLLRELEALKLIRIHLGKSKKESTIDKGLQQYKGTMTKQPINEVDIQLEQLRNGWD